MAEGAAILAGADGGVDPALVEEALDDGGETRRETAIGVEHDHLGVVPAAALVGVLGQGRVAVPMFEPVEAEPARLDRVVAVRQAGIGVAHRRDQGVDHPVLDLVGEVAARDRPLKRAPAVLDRLVLGQRVGDAGEQADVLGQDPADRGRGGLAHRPVLGRQLVEDLGRGQVGAVEGKAQSRHRLVEQPDPGGAAGDRLLVQDALDLVVELVRAKTPHVAQVGPVAGEAGRGLDQRVEPGILDAV